MSNKSSKLKWLSVSKRRVAVQKEEQKKLVCQTELFRSRANDSGTSYVTCDLCKTCNQDHSFKTTFEGVKSSIDVITELLQEKKVWRS
jgi:hypothetical protein